VWFRIWDRRCHEGRSGPGGVGGELRLAVRVIVRLFLGPLVIALLAGIQLSRYGAFTAVAGAYLTFAIAEAAVVLWGRYQVRSPAGA
jgi:hypothetical protein